MLAKVSSFARKLAQKDLEHFTVCPLLLLLLRGPCDFLVPYRCCLGPDGVMVAVISWSY